MRSRLISLSNSAFKFENSMPLSCLYVHLTHWAPQPPVEHPPDDAKIGGVIFCALTLYLQTCFLLFGLSFLENHDKFVVILCDTHIYPHHSSWKKQGWNAQFMENTACFTIPCTQWSWHYRECTESSLAVANRVYIHRMALLPNRYIGLECVPSKHLVYCWFSYFVMAQSRSYLNVFLRGLLSCKSELERAI